MKSSAGGGSRRAPRDLALAAAAIVLVMALATKTVVATEVATGAGEAELAEDREGIVLDAGGLNVDVAGDEGSGDEDDGAPLEVAATHSSGVAARHRDHVTQPDSSVAHWQPTQPAATYSATISVDETEDEERVDSRAPDVASSSLNAARQPSRQTGLWAAENWSECSSTCGEGVRHRVVRCVDQLSQAPLDDAACDGNDKPNASKPCFQIACQPIWYHTDWSACTGECGRRGVQQRLVFCAKEEGDGSGGRLPRMLPEVACSEAGMSRPIAEQHCTVTGCRHWHSSNWSLCNSVCGQGERTRKIVCRSDDGRLLDEEECEERSRPADSEPCEAAMPCGGVDWVVSDWGPCIGGCNGIRGGVQTRQVVCSGADGRPLAEAVCNPETRPIWSRDCDTPASECLAAAKVKAEWFTSDWSSCSASCGKGQQTRIVVCVSRLPSGHRAVVSDRECGTDLRRSIATRRDCDTNRPCPAAWHTSRFSDCHWDDSRKTAGVARRAFCLPGQFNVPAADADCTSDTRPYTHEPCSRHAEEDYDRLHERCKASAFGCCSDGITSALGPALSGCPQRDNAIDCHKSAFGCCPDGVTMAIGSFQMGCSAVKSCKDTRYGCCGDGVTPALGDGSDAIDRCNAVSPCFDSEWGCCEDKKNAAAGPGLIGCHIGPAEAVSSGTNKVKTLSATEEACSIDGHTGCKDTNKAVAEAAPASNAGAAEVSVEPAATTSLPSETDELSGEACVPGAEGGHSACGLGSAGTTTSESLHLHSEASSTTAAMTTLVDTKAAAVGASEPSDEDDRDDESHNSGASAAASTQPPHEEVKEQIVVAEKNAPLGAAVAATEDGSHGEPAAAAAAETTTAEAATEAAAVVSTTSPPARGVKVCHAPRDLVVNGSSDEDDATLVNISWQPPASRLPDGAHLVYTVYYSEVASAPLEEWDQTTTNETSIQLALDPRTTYYFKASARVAGADTDGPTSFTYQYATTEDRGMVLQGGCHATQYGCCADGLTSATGPRHSGCIAGATSAEAAVAAAAAAAAARRLPPSQSLAQDRPVTSAPRDFAATGLTLNDVGVLARMSWQPPSEGVVIDYYVLYYADDHTRPLAEWQKVVLPETSITATFPRGVNVYFRVGAHNAVSDGPLTDVYHFVADEGSECQAVRPPCADSEHGCCPDGSGTAAAGPALQGCGSPESATTRSWTAVAGSETGSPSSQVAVAITASTAVSVDDLVAERRPLLIGGCRGTRWGCCSDGRTSAHGPDRLGCAGDPQPCDVSAFGCCPDGQSAASGLDFMGCSSSLTPTDERTAVERDCTRTFYGCCPDGITPATGLSLAGCPDQTAKGDVCSLTWDVGPGSNYTIKWYFDVLNGVCRRFWYGGEGGNDNRFDDEKLCKSTCVQPDGTDVCFLPPSTGRCKASINRWYYDARAGSCRQFTYGGCFGNKNNFESQRECDRSCRLPLRKDACSQSKVTGPCRAAFRRWHYDSSSGSCEEFTYGGCGGNSNRFTTPEDCQKRCVDRDAKDICTLPIEQGPCRALIPKWAFDVKTGGCRQFYYGGCRGNANSFDTQDECSDVCGHRKLTMRDVCRQEPDGGSCGGNETQYYYDHRLGTCQSFVYGGCEGNSNRFASHEECMKSCRRHLADAEFNVDTCLRSPAVSSEQCRPRDGAAAAAAAASTTLYTYDAEDGQCKQLAPGSCGGGSSTSVSSDNVFESGEACEHSCAAQYDNVAADDDICKLPADGGQCASQNVQVRWAFDSALGVCKSFAYTGCRGNRNNFYSEESCLSQCHRRPAFPEDVCMLPRDGGHCHGSFVRYYYDQESGVCRQFNYTGCGGNANKFAIAEDCSSLCAPRGLPSLRGQASAASGHDVCTQPVEVGPCRAAFRRWFFDPELHACSPFVYGGCRGNGNNFHSHGECAKRCQMRDPSRVDVCSLPVASGPCLMRLPRWYFDESEHRCKPFTYGGCQGNGNRFISESECSSRCGAADTDGGDGGGFLTVIVPLHHEPTTATAAGVHAATPSPPLSSVTEPAAAAEVSPVSAAASDASATTVAAASTATASTAVNDSATIARKVDEACTLPVDRTDCAKSQQHQKQTRFYYDGVTRLCRPFRFHGCGNASGFDSAAACAAACHLSTPSASAEHGESPNLLSRRDCFDSPDVGQCTGSHARYYYDHKRGVCEMFYYGGCGGNRNNFLSADDCSAFCVTEARQCPVLSCPPETSDSRRCPHGVAFDDSGCPTCDCHDPCSGVTCPAGSRCLARDPQCPDFDSATCQKADPVCMPVTKPGECPLRNDTTAFESCGEHPTCADDASCGGDDKCCDSDACGLVCVGLATARGLSRSSSEECLTSEYGCCLDGTTPAKGYGYKGCPERRPRIIRPSGHGSQYVAAVGETVRLPCVAIGSPAPRIDWYRNRKPIRLESEPRLTLLDNGTLVVAPIAVDDNAEYICRAYNGVGDPAYEYLTIQVRDHVMITESSADVTSVRGVPIELQCKASGSPAPTITWMFDGKPLNLDSDDVDGAAVAGPYARGEFGSLIIRQLSPEEEGDYVCFAQNTVNAASKVISVSIEEHLAALLSTYNSSVMAGTDLQLTCSTTGYPPPKVSWTFNGESLPYEDRIVISGDTLVVKDLQEADSGNYTCIAENGKHATEAVATVTVLPQPTRPPTTTAEPVVFVPASCGDRPSLANCGLIVRYNYCGHPWYKNLCCRSCFLAGKLPADAIPRRR